MHIYVCIYSKYIKLLNKIHFWNSQKNTKDQYSLYISINAHIYWYIYLYIHKCTHIHIYKTLPIIFLRKMNSIIKTTGKTKPKQCLKKKKCNRKSVAIKKSINTSGKKKVFAAKLTVNTINLINKFMVNQVHHFLFPWYVNQIHHRGNYDELPQHGRM